MDGELRKRMVASRSAHNEPLVLPDEEWKEVGESGHRVSNLGRYQSKTGKPHHVKLNHQGRAAVMIDGKGLSLSHLVCTAFNGPPAPDLGAQVLIKHIDGNKGNCASTDLEWVTRSEVMTMCNTHKRPRHADVSNDTQHRSEMLAVLLGLLRLRSRGVYFK